jgi:toxin ParE1/3/4
MARRRRLLLWSTEARADLSDIWDYYAKAAGQQSADNVVRRIEAGCRVLETHPFGGRGRDEIRPGLRSITARPHVIFYRVRGDRAEIIRILDGRRDIGEVFGNKPDGE